LPSERVSIPQRRAEEQMKFQLRALEASKRAIEKGLAILKLSAKRCKPTDAARLLAVGDMIGRAALGLNGGTTGAFGLNPIAPPRFTIVIRRDEQSEQVKRNEDKFFAEHPEIKRPRWLENLQGELRPDRETD
jgi:hypothetical protein